MKNAPCWAETTGVSSLMISEATSVRSRRPCMRPEIRARLPLSQSCSLLARVVSRRLVIIVLMLSWSAWISPAASTSIFSWRSPRVTAVATAAMARTWRVRFCAISFTDSVRSRQVPSTSRTRAWPPSWPSVPTSRATRVTCSAKEESWSTMVLMVVFSSRISPRASMSIFLVRSPLAMAVVTIAMLRTWPVRLEAIEFTDSVRSFHVPELPGTRAWPPRMPSVPTSRATRVTSSAKDDRVVTMVLTVSASWATSPLASTVTFLVRSPLATAVATWAMFRTWPVRLFAIVLTLSLRSFQMPVTPGTRA